MRLIERSADDSTDARIALALHPARARPRGDRRRRNLGQRRAPSPARGAWCERPAGVGVSFVISSSSLVVGRAAVGGEELRYIATAA